MLYIADVGGRYGSELQRSDGRSQDAAQTKQNHHFPHRSIVPGNGMGIPRELFVRLLESFESPYIHAGQVL